MEQGWQRLQKPEEQEESKEKIKFFHVPKGRISHAACLDGQFRDRMFIHGGSSANAGQENMSDLWIFDF